MPNDPSPPSSTRNEDLSVTEYDAERRTKMAAGSSSDAAVALPTNDEAPEVGLSQKGEGENAIVKRETEV